MFTKFGEGSPECDTVDRIENFWKYQGIDLVIVGDWPTNIFFKLFH